MDHVALPLVVAGPSPTVLDGKYFVLLSRTSMLGASLKFDVKKRKNNGKLIWSVRH